MNSYKGLFSLGVQKTQRMRRNNGRSDATEVAQYLRGHPNSETCATKDGDRFDEADCPACVPESPTDKRETNEPDNDRNSLAAT